MAKTLFFEGGKGVAKLGSSGVPNLVSIDDFLAEMKMEREKKEKFRQEL